MKSKLDFNTIGLFTTDNKRMVEFYRDVMGFETDWNGEDWHVELHQGAIRLIMFPRSGFEQMTSRKYSYPEGLNGTMELSFDVPTHKDVDEEYARATAMGARSVFEPQTMPWGQRTCYIADPEGNLIEIGSFNAG